MASSISAPFVKPPDEPPVVEVLGSVGAAPVRNHVHSSPFLQCPFAKYTQALGPRDDELDELDRTEDVSESSLLCASRL